MGTISSYKPGDGDHGVGDDHRGGGEGGPKEMGASQMRGQPRMEAGDRAAAWSQPQREREEETGRKLGQGCEGKACFPKKPPSA